MRILMTESGKTMLDSVKDLSFDSDVKSNKRRRVKISASPSQRRVLKTSDSTSSIQEKPSQFVKVRQKKVSLPRNISEYYNTYNDPNSILPAIPENASNLLVDRTKSLRSEDSADEDNVKLKEIFKEKVLKKIKTQVKQDTNMKRKLFTFRQDDYRKGFPSEKADLKKINSKLNYKIEANKVGLINYLSKKQKINYKLVNSINSYSPTKLSKLNKICQKISKKEDFEGESRQKSANKLQNRYKGLQNDIKQSLSKVEGCLSKYKQMSLKQSPVKPKHVAFYMDKLNNMKRNYWNKLRIERFSKKDNSIA